MNFNQYKNCFKDIVDKDPAEHNLPYNNPDYLDYTKLNWSRMNRWFKTGKLSDALVKTIHSVKSPQNWIIITEPWCGDASHNIPFIEMIAGENPLISVSYQLRDSEPHLIEKYLTNGTKSIPKLIIRDEENIDLGTWGPRPFDCQNLYSDLLKENAGFEKIKLEIQNWYNADKGASIQQELDYLIKQIL
ncbi:thioredoxin family protein [Flavobacterium sp. CGRL1]